MRTRDLFSTQSAACLVLLLLTALAILSCPAFSALPPVPQVSSYVTDTAGVLSPEGKAGFERSLRALQSETAGVQFIVYVEPLYPKEYSLEEYALKIAEGAKLGAQGKDNGLLLYVAVQDGAYRWEAGYGVESALPAPLLGRISRQYLVPNFRNGDYEAGISEAVRVASLLMKNSTDPDIAALREASSAENADPASVLVISAFFIVILLFIVASVVSAARAAKSGRASSGSDHFFRSAATGIFLGGMRGGFSGGGGSFGGGFSGGGGSFGGGGFSGKW